MEEHRRKDIRLSGWDYASHACYHVTICSHERAPIFGRVVAKGPGDAIDSPAATVLLSPVGSCCERAISEICNASGYAHIEKYAVMPNHAHLLIWLDGGDNARRSLGSAIRFLKSKATRYAREVGFEGTVWQKGFYDRIIRDDEAFDEVWKYIDENPAKWALDKYFCEQRDGLAGKE